MECGARTPAGCKVRARDATVCHPISRRAGGSMQEAQNTKVVQDAYASFAEGNVAGVLALVDESVVWQGATGASPDVPMGGVRHGRAEVAEFFRHVGEHITFSR